MLEPMQRSDPALVRANRVDVCYDTFGDRAAPPVLLIMGLGAQLIQWDDEFCAGLAQRGFWVIRFDNRDVGLSTKMPARAAPRRLQFILARAFGRLAPVPYRLCHMADDAVGLLDALGIGSAHIVGLSMGGMIAQELAIRRPERVRTLTSIMSTTGDPRLPRPTPEAAAVVLTPTPTEEAAFLEHYLRAWRTYQGPGFPLDEARDRERGMLAFRRGVYPAGRARQLLAIFASGDRTKALRSVTVPTLVIHGDADPLVPVEAGCATARAIPNADLLILKGMGHALPIQMWPQIINAIADKATGYKTTAPTEVRHPSPGAPRQAPLPALAGGKGRN